MPIQNGKYVSPIWHDNAPPAINAAELQAITDSVVGNTNAIVGNTAAIATNATNITRNATAIESVSQTVYGVCDTPTANTAKVVTVSKFNIQIGSIVVIKFNYTISGDSSLNINGTGAYRILLNGIIPFQDTIVAGSMCTFVYSGGVWNLLSVDTYATRRPTSSQNFSNDSWDTIQAICRAGLHEDRYTIGSTKEIVRSGVGAVTLRIEDFNHDNLTSGGKASMTIMSQDVSGDHRMNSTNTNIGGWRDSEMRSYLSTTYYQTLPMGLQNIINSVEKLSTLGKGSSTIIATSDKIWLASMTEIGLDIQYNKGEGFRYPLFIDNPSRTKSFKWVLRSAFYNNDNFTGVDGVGEYDSVTPTVGGGIVFGFCI